MTAPLRDRLLGVLRYAEEHLDRWEDLALGLTGDLEEVSSRFDKLLTDTANLAFLAARVPPSVPGVAESAGRVAAAVAALARGDRARSSIRRFPQRARWFWAITHAYLSELGLPDAEFDDLVDGALATGLTEWPEAPPSMVMVRRWQNRWLGSGAGPTECDDLVPGSILTAPTHPLYMSVADVYALTHAVWSATDYGREPFPHAVDARRLAELVDACLAWQTLAANLDTTVELLMCAAICARWLGAEWSPHACLAWRVVVGAWEGAAALCGPRFDEEASARLPDEERWANRFWRCYHTTYMGGKLCALLLEHRVDEPPAARRASLTAALQRAGLDDLAACVDEPARSSWAAVRDTLREDPGLLAAALDGAMSCAARRYDLASLGAAIDRWTAEGLPASPTLAAVRAFVRRQTA